MAGLAGLRDGSGSGISLSYKDRGRIDVILNFLWGLVVYLIVIVVAAVTQLTVIDIGLLILLSRLLLDAGYLLPFPLGILYLLLYDRDNVLMDTQIII